jgi:nucleotide-binding universal stress UspA family protein
MKVLLAIDGSRYSADVTDAVVSRPWPSGTIVRVLSAVELQVIAAGAKGERPLELERRTSLKAAEELTGWVASSLLSRQLPVDVTVLVGDPREVIINEAQNWGADLIMMGAYGHSGVKQWLLGSVAESVVNHAPCSVEVVRKTHWTGNEKCELEGAVPSVTEVCLGHQV